MKSIVLSGFLLAGAVGAAQASIVRSDESLVDTIKSSDRYLFGYVRWSAVGAFGYGRPFLFNYEIALDGEKPIIVCTQAPLTIGQKALVVLKKHEQAAPMGCSKGSTYIPMGRLDTFIYPVSSAIDLERDWVALPPAVKQDVGCKAQTLEYDITVTDGGGKKTSDYAGALSATNFVLWQDLRKCL